MSEEQLVKKDKTKKNKIKNDKKDKKKEEPKNEEPKKEEPKNEEPTNEENSSQKKVNEIDLHYLLNDCKQISQSKKLVSAKNKKFYRKRIIQLTKDLFNDEIVADGNNITESPKKYHPDIYKTFETYIGTCIDYFQTIDRTDILQEDYKDLEDSLANLDNLLEPSNLESSVFEANKRLMRSINIKTNTLDGLVKRTVIKKEEPILPKKKKINLKDPELKNKGIIGKKDNLTNN